MSFLEKDISSRIMNQFPDFYREEGPVFQQFVKAYYEWLEESGNIQDHSRSLLDYNDIDETSDQFVTHFIQKYMAQMPKRLLGDKRLLIKNILDVYRSKGSIEGLKLLFVLLFNEKIDVYIPSEDILKASDSTWTVRKYLEVSFTANLGDYHGKMITGSISGATAVVDQYERKIVGNRPIYTLYISSVNGTFQPYELVLTDDIDQTEATEILGSISEVTVLGAVPNFSLGEEVEFTSQDGSGFFGTVSSIETKSGIIEFEIENGGTGYSIDASPTITSGSNTSGQDANFIIGSISNTEIYEYNNDKLASYANVGLDDSTYSANGSDTSGLAFANSANVIGDALEYINVEVGTIASVIFGVAIATALMPPLCTAGYGLAKGNLIYFLGALYLFTINTIFIALATFLVMKLLRFPMHKYANAAKRKRYSTIATVVGIAVMIPAIFTFINVFNENKINNQIESFIKNEVKSNNALTLIDYDLPNLEEKKLKLNFFNEVSDATYNDLQNELANNMAYTSLKEFKLEIKGSDTKSFDLITTAYKEKKEELQESKNIIAGLQKQIIELQEKISSLNNSIEQNAFSKNQKAIAFSRIVKEAKIRYNNIESIAFSRELYSKDFIKIDTIPVATINWNDKLKDSVLINKELELRAWLQKEMKLDTLFIKRE